SSTPGISATARLPRASPARATDWSRTSTWTVFFSSSVLRRVASTSLESSGGTAARAGRAVEKTASVGISADDGFRWSGGLRLRYIGSRPLIEDDSVRAEPSLIANLRLGYRIRRGLQLIGEVLNLTDRQVSDIAYYYPSRLPGEAAAVDDIHLHPAEPRTIRLALRADF
ncbi:MAG: TonB-dependent receptor, partial [Zoogloea sp.]|nr:TonB-dependent receptor [Zoogloea sp.]